MHVTSCTTLGKSLCTRWGLASLPLEGCCEVGDSAGHMDSRPRTFAVLRGGVSGRQKLVSQREGRSPGQRQPDSRHPELYLPAGRCQARHPQALITKEADSISSGKGVWTQQTGKGPWPRIAETERQRLKAGGTLWRYPGDLRGGCQTWSSPDKAQLHPASLTPGMPVDINSAAFRLWQILNGSSFHGCIRNLYINNELQDFTKTRMKPGVVPGCEPCRKLYCLHGICQPSAMPGPVCHCETGWGGLHCDQPADGPCHGHK